MYWETRGSYRILVGVPEGRRPLVRPRLRCEDNIKIEMQEVGIGGGDMDWIDLALVNAVMNLRVP
jgi:hypothetical protein